MSMTLFLRHARRRPPRTAAKQLTLAALLPTYIGVSLQNGQEYPDVRPRPVSMTRGTTVTPDAE